MDQPIEFGDQDARNLELVRQIVLRRLKEDKDYHDMIHDLRFEKYVNFHNHQNRNRFAVLAREVMWEFMFQGVISPGLNAANPNFPFFHVTDYGKEVLEAERFLPHDPAGYIGEIGKVSRVCVNEITLAYLEEALRCFSRGCHLASVLLLGVAAESVFLSLCTVIRASLKDPNDFTKLDDILPVKQKHRWVADKYENLPARARREQLPESLGITMTALYELIRRQRNDLGHPASLPQLTRDQAFVFFRLFPAFVADLETFAEYCKNRGL